MNKKKISIWGSTGSIGRQTLEVISRNEERFHIATLTVHNNAALGLEQARTFKPESVVITGDLAREEWEEKFRPLGVELLWGREGLLKAAGMGAEDLVVNALVGAVGLEATMEALKAKTSIAISNKEVLVMAGEIVTQEADKQGVKLLPIDSEHSALFQCLEGEDKQSVQRLILTASGGPFLNRDRSGLENVTVEEALAHPNWSMGKKVTIDSATLMNKGLEIIEARWLFGIDPDRIDVVIHPQSIIHSMVEFIDGSIKAQMGLPDMRVPISYALTYPERWKADTPKMDFSEKTELTFLPPDDDRFTALQLAYEALSMGGTAPAVLNAADEVAVEFFLNGKIKFMEISQIIQDTLQNHEVILRPGIDDILLADRWARDRVLNRIKIRS